MIPILSLILCLALLILQIACFLELRAVKAALNRRIGAPPPPEDPDRHPHPPIPIERGHGRRRADTTTIDVQEVQPVPASFAAVQERQQQHRTVFDEARALLTRAPTTKPSKYVPRQDPSFPEYGDDGRTM